ncbi:MAG: tetratricopeptide repeat protein, partial [Deltaproteobacteria bacterium]|nr:tetratricopeptide repeat protein [Kofleriaceae bacterium]
HTARLADDPDDAPLSRLLGELHLAAGRRDDAKAAWLFAEALGDTPARTLRVQAFGPERGLDHFDAALDLLDRRLREDAAAEFETAVDAFRQELRAPGDGAHRYLAKSLYNSALLRELKVADEVIEPNLREAVELDGAYADAMNSLGTLCLRTDRVDEGLQWFARAGETDPTAGQPWYYRARHFAESGDHAQAIEDATKAFDAYARRGQTQFAADAVMMRGRSNENLGRLQDALRDYDLAYEYGHPTGYAMGDHIRQRIAVEDPDSDQAGELLEKVIERIEDGECPWAQIEFLESRTGADEKATALVAKLKGKTPLDGDELRWLVEFLYAS